MILFKVEIILYTSDMTVYIFGDSYGHAGNKRLTYRTWFDMIGEPVVNKSRGSASPYYCMRRLNEAIYLISEDDKIIFIMSDKTRLDFPFLQKIDHASTSHTILSKHPVLNDSEKYLLEYKHEIDMVFSMFDKEVDMYPFLIISYLKYVSQKIKCKIIVIPSFESTTFKLKFLDPFYFNSDIFKVLDIDLYRISCEEFIDEKYSEQIEAKRRCHLSYENHVILFNIISNFFYDTSHSEIFHKNLYKTEGKKLEKFIYN